MARKGKTVEEQIGYILGQYADEAQQKVWKTTWKIAGNARKDIQETSDVETNKHWAHGVYDQPRPTDKDFFTRDAHGTYKKGWQRKREFRGSLFQETTIQNKTDWQLTHLLAKGHALKVGGRDTSVTVSPKKSSGIYSVKDKYESENGIYVTSLTKEIEKIK